MKESKQKEYTHNGFTVVWKPDKCIHSGVCVQKLPAVYHPKEKPWITPENATEEELRKQIDACPSGALSYKTDSGKNDAKVEIQTLKNGPLMIKGDCEMRDSDGNLKKLSGNNALCRCGASNDKPFCDGTHTKINFADE